MDGGRYGSPPSTDGANIVVQEGVTGGQAVGMIIAD
jgi:hypothetical protein